MCVWMYLFYVQSIYAITIWNPLIYSVAILFKIYLIYFNKLFIGFVLSLWATWSHLECMLWISLFWIDKYVCLLVFFHLIIYENNYMGSSTLNYCFHVRHWIYIDIYLHINVWTYRFKFQPRRLSMQYTINFMFITVNLSFNHSIMISRFINWLFTCNCLFFIVIFGFEKKVHKQNSFEKSIDQKPCS